MCTTAFPMDPFDSGIFTAEDSFSKMTLDCATLKSK